jgi:hypothetical protein
MQIRWKRCRSYDEARSFCGVVYLHEWHDKPFYWGICDKSVFGGTPRPVDGVKRNPRYGISYRHWIDGCLQHGGRLYMGTPTGGAGRSLEDIERTLIAQYPPELNDGGDGRMVIHDIEHSGDVPPCIKARLTPAPADPPPEAAAAG